MATCSIIKLKGCGREGVHSNIKFKEGRGTRSISKLKGRRGGAINNLIERGEGGPWPIIKLKWREREGCSH